MPTFRASLWGLLVTLSGHKRVMSDPQRFAKAYRRRRERGPARPPRNLLRRMDVTETMVQGRHVFVASPRRRPAVLDIIYLHGGGFVEDLWPMHWQAVAGLVDRTDARVFVPAYPLAPDATWREVHAFLRAVHDGIASNDTGRPLVLAGDSAGGNLALSLAIALRSEPSNRIAGLVLISPWLDLTVSDPRRTKLNRRDPTMAIPGLRHAADAYAAGTPLTSPNVSPLLADLDGLPPILCVSGTRDTLSTDADRLREKIEEIGGSIDLLEGADMLHIWPLFPIPEARETLDRIGKFIKFAVELQSAS